MKKSSRLAENRPVLRKAAQCFRLFFELRLFPEVLVGVFSNEYEKEFGNLKGALFKKGSEIY